MSRRLECLRKYPKKTLLKRAIKIPAEKRRHEKMRSRVSRGPIRLSDEEFLSMAGCMSVGDFFRQFESDPPKFFFDDCKKTAAASRKSFPKNAAVSIKKADSACRHIFNLLGSGPKSLGKEINWHRDFKSGKTWPLVYHADIEYVNIGDNSDVKVPWELSRCQHFLPLGKAYLYTGNRKYAREFVSQLRSWIRENPPETGVNWAVSMEAAIRAVNWIWAYHLFGGSEDFSMRDRLEMLKSLYFHAEHIITNLEYNYEFSGNHYLSDGVGLVFLGIFLRRLKGSEKWLSRGISIIEESMKNQVLPDGADFEKSIPYHGLVTELFLHTFILCRRNGIRLPEWFEKKLVKMLEFTAHYTKPDGMCPMFGDSDDGRLAILDDASHVLDHRRLLSTGCAIFSNGIMKASAGKLSEETLWLLGPGSLETFRKVKPAKTPSVFSAGGFYIARSGGDYIFLDCGGLGLRGRGGHGHNDTLSFELCLNGKCFITDSGTYTYTSDYRARNHFRSTRAHNTVVLDNKEAAPFAERDLWHIRDITDPKVLKWEETENGAVFEGRHSGYSRLGAVCRRRVIFDRKKGEWTIEDFIEGKGKHTAEIFFHLVPVRPERRGLSVSAKIGGTGMEIIPEERDGLSLEILQDWVSFNYGTRVRAPVIRYKKTGNLPLKFKTVIRERVG